MRKTNLQPFWMAYVEMVDILRGLLLADREGDWPLHLSCIPSMIHWCFALDKINYARYLPVYYAQMSRLQETSPVLHDHFPNGGFSVQLKMYIHSPELRWTRTLMKRSTKIRRRQGGPVASVKLLSYGQISEICFTVVAICKMAPNTG